MGGAGAAAGAGGLGGGGQTSSGGAGGETATGGAAGSGGSAATGGSGGATGGAGGAGGDGGSGGGASAASRMFVAQAQAAGPIAVWDDPGALTADTAPDATFGYADDATSVVGTASRLFAFRDGAFDVYEDPATLASAAPANETVASASLGAAARPRIMGGDLWITTGSPGSVLRYESADTLTSASLAAAELTHQWGQLSDAAFLSGQDRLLATQVSGAGLLAYDDVSSATGTVEQDWIFSNTSGWSMALGADSLYVSGLSGSSGPYLRIYRSVSTITTTAVPSVALTTGLDDCLWIGLFHGRLVMVSQAPGTAYLFLDAAAITGASVPDVTISLPTTLPLGMALDGADNLYVLDTDHVYIYADATTTPTLRATLDTGVSGARRLWLLE